MIYKNSIKRIQPVEAYKMIKALADTETPGENMPQGLFIWQESGKWIAMDNLDGYAWIEEFNTEYEAEHWLLGW